MAVTIRHGAPARLRARSLQVARVRTQNRRSLCAERAFTRRHFLTTAASSAAVTVAGGIAKPSISRAADRPSITHGIQSGDVSVDSGVVWARTDRPARMLVEAATTDSFKTIRSAVAVDALPESDFTAKVLLEDLPAGQDIFYRVRFEDLASPTIVERAAGRPLPHRADRPALGLVRLVGRHRRPGLGHRRGARRHAHLRDHAAQPARTSSSIPATRIYADCPIPRSRSCRTARSGATSSPRRSPRSRETLADFRGNYKYNLLDAQRARASTPRSRCSRSGTITRSPTTGGPGETARRTYATPACLAARGARPPRLLRIHADARRRMAEAGPRLSQDLLRPAARRVHARHAELSRPERPATPIGPARRFLGPTQTRLAQARA